jgi:hypothetical protein
MTSFLEYTIASRAKLAPLAIFTTLLISSCSDPATVGLELAPGNNQIGVFYQEFNLDAQMVLLDSFSTTNSNVLVVGSESDDFFGKTESTGYSRLYIDATKGRPAAEAILDSMFFNMAVVSVNGSDLDQLKRFSIHKLAEPILDTLYYNVDEVAYQENAFAQIDVKFGEEKDSVLQLSINEEFRNDLFEKMKSGPEFHSLTNFRNYFPGIAIKASEENNATVAVAIGSNTGIVAYYHVAGDTIAKRYDIASYPARSFSGVKSDRTGTPTESITEAGKAYDVGSIVGMKSTLGMALRIDTSPLDAFLDTLDGVTFNQVDFTLGAIETQDKNNSPITGMVMMFVDNNNNPVLSTVNKTPLYVQGDSQTQVFLDAKGDKVPNNTYSTSAILKYDSEDKIYQAGITSHVNAIYRGDILRQNWILYGTFPSTSAMPSSGDEFKRSLRQFKVNKSKILVKVIYSKSR